MVGVQGLQMVDESEYLSVIIQTSFQWNSIVHPKLKHVLRDCISVGLTNADVEGVSYDEIGLPQDRYLQYRSIEDNTKQKSPHSKRVAISNGQIQIIPDRPNIPRPIARPRKSKSPIRFSEATTSQAASFLTPEIYPKPPAIEHSIDLYIPEENPFMAINKMFRSHTTDTQVSEEWQFANKRFVRGGKWPPKTKFCTSSSQSK